MWRYGITIRTYVQLGCITGGVWLEERRTLIWSSGSIPRFVAVRCPVVLLLLFIVRILC